MKSLTRCLIIALSILSNAAFAQESLRQDEAAPRLGFDLASRDLSVRPGDDFNRYASGHWLDTTVIPADRPSDGSKERVYLETQAALRSIVEADARQADATGDTARIGRLYTSFMDEDTVERLGAAPLAHDLAVIRALRDHAAVAAMTGRSAGGFGARLFRADVYEDMKDPSVMCAYVHQDGLGLPTRAFYLDEKFAGARAAYLAYVTQMLTLAGWPEPGQSANQVVSFETRLAGVQWPPEQTRDFVAMYHPATLDDLQRMAPGFSWSAWAKAAGIPRSARLIASEDTAFPKMATLFAQADMATLRAWLAFHLVDNAAPYLSRAFVDARFAFRGTLLRGTPANRPRASRGVQLVDQQLGEALGRQYVQGHLSAGEKAAAVALVDNVAAAMRARLQRVDWMGPATRTEAIRKIDKLRARVGYPDTWRSYDGLRIAADDLYGNVARAQRFEWEWQVRRLDRPADPGVWDITPQTVNAYYNASRNEIVLPAAILQAFDPAADAAITYGTLGGFVGHEITHGFDDNGRKTDADGQLRDWWTAQDAARFQARADALGAQYDAIEALPGTHLSGKLTMSENIADLGGITLAIDAYHRSLQGRPAPVVAGLSAEQRIFLGWAQLWREKIREEALREQVATDEHAPGAWRVIMPIRNVQAWYDVYAVTPDEKYYLPPAQRVSIW